MAGYENSSLWQMSLSKRIEDDKYSAERDFFRVNLEHFREKAQLLASEIHRDLPEYTVHDITHIDALWEMASIICGKDFYINPAESFVLGCAFLIHDLGMGLAAYPRGINALKEEVIWSDTYSYLSQFNDGVVDEKQVIEIVLRKLHAQHAEKLAFASWGNSGDKEHLIDNSQLRFDYGAVIGKIAHSHWWDSSELVSKFPSKLGASANMPNEWDVDSLKLACIIRAADASHIDSRRAPAFLRKIRELNKYSAEHWTFQQRLYQPRIEREKLVYTSKSPFSMQDAASWWLCIDTLRMIDNELYLVDSLLHSNNRPRFDAKGVAGIDHLRSIERLIPTTGWEPVDTKIHVGNITQLVENLGGSQLYGENLLVPLRELVQNACDAIRARRLLECEDDDFGRVNIRLNKDESGIYIEVEDNGVGMSSRVLSGPFLDFGTSFWNSALMHDELPGLQSKGYRSTGKFGVGFFSVFMWGYDVTVTSRRYEEARQSTKILAFNRGDLSRPLLKSASENEYIRDGGTRIRVYLKSEEYLSKLLSRTYRYNFDSIADLIRLMFPASDVDLHVQDKINDVNKIVIKANDWKTISNQDFVNRVLDYEYLVENYEIDEESYSNILRLSENTTLIESNGQVLGRGFLAPANGDVRRFGVEYDGMLTVGGYRTNEVNDFIGLLLSETYKASRDLAYPLIPKDDFKAWVKNQITLLKKNEENQVVYIRLSELCSSMQIDIGDMVFAKSADTPLNRDAFGKLLREHETIYLVSSYELRSLREAMNGDIKIKENVISISDTIRSFLDNPYSGFNDLDFWPGVRQDYYSQSTLIHYVAEAINKEWGIPVREFLDWELDNKGGRKRAVIGHNNGLDLTASTLKVSKSELEEYLDKF